MQNEALPLPSSRRASPAHRSRSRRAVLWSRAQHDVCSVVDRRVVAFAMLALVSLCRPVTATGTFYMSSGCPGPATLLTGSGFTSIGVVNAPTYYPSMQCSVLVQSTSLLPIALSFTMFSTEGCCDHLYVGFGVSAAAPRRRLASCLAVWALTLRPWQGVANRIGHLRIAGDALLVAGGCTTARASSRRCWVSCRETSTRRSQRFLPPVGTCCWRSHRTAVRKVPGFLHR